MGIDNLDEEKKKRIEKLSDSLREFFMSQENRSPEDWASVLMTYFAMAVKGGGLPWKGFCEALDDAKEVFKAEWEK